MQILLDPIHEELPSLLVSLDPFFSLCFFLDLLEYLFLVFKLKESLNFSGVEDVVDVLQDHRHEDLLVRQDEYCRLVLSPHVHQQAFKVVVPVILHVRLVDIKAKHFGILEKGSHVSKGSPT